MPFSDSKELQKCLRRLKKEAESAAEWRLSKHGIQANLTGMAKRIADAADFAPLLDDLSFPVQWTVYMQGPLDTVWESGVFEIHLLIPQNYPNAPPTLKFADPVFHPNVSSGGEVCCKLLQEQWLPAARIEQVLHTTRSFLDDGEKDFGVALMSSWSSSGADAVAATGGLAGSSAAAGAAAGTANTQHVYVDPDTKYEVRGMGETFKFQGESYPCKLYHYTTTAGRDLIKASGVLKGSVSGLAGAGVYAIHPGKAGAKEDVLSNNYGLVWSNDERADYVIELGVEKLVQQGGYQVGGDVCEGDRFFYFVLYVFTSRAKGWKYFSCWSS